MLKDLIITKEKYKEELEKARKTKEYQLGYAEAIRICEKGYKERNIFKCHNCQNESFLYRRVKIKECPICKIAIK